MSTHRNSWPLLLAILPLLISAVLLALPVVASADEGVKVGLAPTATLIEGGQAVLVEVEVECPRKRDVLEAFVYVSQDGYQSQFAGIPVRCTGRSHTYLVRVQASPDQLFHTGEAYASVYVLVYDSATGTTQSAGANRTIQIR